MITLRKRNNVLVIADTHIPFEHPDYLEFCLQQKKVYKCNQVVHIGDVCDSHASSFHTPSPDGLSPKDELTAAKLSLSKWKKAFKDVVVYCTVGNHDAIPARKLYANGLSSSWLRTYNDVYDLPDWRFDVSFKLDKVLYTHGIGSNNLPAIALNNRMSTVIGHWHTKFAIEYNQNIFGMAVGCGINIESYCFEYARDFVKKPVLGCAVVLDGGRQPILVPMR